MSNPKYDHPSDDPAPTPKSRDERLAEEIERLRGVYRVGTSDQILRRAAINAMMDRGDW